MVETEKGMQSKKMKKVQNRKKNTKLDKKGTKFESFNSQVSGFYTVVESNTLSGGARVAMTVICSSYI